MILEICANSLQSALAAQTGGADRIELCDNMAEGGTTPSFATIVKARELLRIQVYPIIRPRGGDFLYDNLEFDLMWKDIELCKQTGCDGVATGLLKSDGSIDKKRTKLLVDLAWPLGVTFHRAFDRCADPFQALQDIIDCGCERILTSGQQPTAPQGADLIAQLIEKACGRIIIMPGSGVRENNIAALVRRTKADEYHSTAKTVVKSNMQFKNKLVTDNEANELTISETDAEIVRRLRELAEKAISS